MVCAWDPLAAVEAFKTLTENWSQTPDQDVNLPGWYSNGDPSPCSLDGAKTKWGEVECLNDDDEDGGGIVIRMIGLYSITCSEHKKVSHMSAACILNLNFGLRPGVTGPSKTPPLLVLYPQQLQTSRLSCHCEFP